MSRPSKFKYTIFRDNSPEAFVNFCLKFEREYPNAIKRKLLVDVDGSTIQVYEVEGKQANIYDDYDVGVVYALSDWDISFIEKYDLGQFVKMMKNGIYGHIVDVREDVRECTIERDIRNKRGIYELIDCYYYNIESVEEKSVFWSIFPSRDFTLEEAGKVVNNISTEKNLSDAFAKVSNTFWQILVYLENDEGDYDEKSYDYIEASEAEREWGILEKTVRNKIFDILREEGVIIPDKGFHKVLVPFMERNGYRDGNGRWIKK